MPDDVSGLVAAVKDLGPWGALVLGVWLLRDHIGAALKAVLTKSDEMNIYALNMELFKALNTKVDAMLAFAKDAEAHRKETVELLSDIKDEMLRRGRM